MDCFHELYRILQLDRQNSAWSKKHDLRSRAMQVKAELEETISAVDEGDAGHISEELGDTLWDLLSTIIIAEEQGITNIDTILNDAIEKMKRRKPWLFTGERLSEEEEANRWKAIKQKELDLGLRKA